MSEQKVRNRPEISVIVPVYRVEKYLNDCIDSILAQTFTDFELILVDDGSPDGCPALCDAAAAKDSRIRVIHQKNRGLSGARNAGLDAAEGEWIAFVDSDDMLLPQALEKAHSTAEKTGADVVLYGFAFTDENGKVYEGWDTTQYDEVIPQQEIYNRLVIGMYQSIRPSTDGLLECLLVFNMPFTFFKGLLDVALCFLIYKPLSPLLHK